LPNYSVSLLRTDLLPTISLQNSKLRFPNARILGDFLNWLPFKVLLKVKFKILKSKLNCVTKRLRDLQPSNEDLKMPTQAKLMHLKQSRQMHRAFKV